MTLRHTSKHRSSRKRYGAGFLLVARDTRRMLLVLRSGAVGEPYTWGLPGGGSKSRDYDERTTALRELQEETGFDGPVAGSSKPVYVFREHSGFVYHNFIGFVEHEFQPELDEENDDCGWFSFEDLPDPLHFGAHLLFERAGDKIASALLVHRRRSSRR